MVWVSEGVRRIRQLLPILIVPACPGSQVISRGEVIGFGRIAALVRDDKVVPQINGIFRPWDKVIDVAGMAPHRLFAVEAPAKRDVLKKFPHSTEVGSFTAEQEFRQVGSGSQDLVVVSADISDPSTPHQVTDHPIELPQAEGHAGPQLDRRASAAVIVQEVETRSSHGLEFPQRHHQPDRVDRDLRVRNRLP